ncbi:MAG: acetyl-CoA C-acyltransferase, partial [bacterium]|nr:acetyl-CoA C-acyltransferase [bacterium]
MYKEKIFLVAGKRTAIGKFGGTLLDISPAELGKITARATIASSGDEVLIGARVNEVIIGNVLGAGHGMNIARQICLGAGLPITTPAYLLNKVCGSGLKAVVLACQGILCGDSELVLAGGVESMSQTVFVSKTARWGAKLGNVEMQDLILQDGLTDVFNSCHMGITAENLATKYNISRKDQDAFALESQKRALLAISSGFFKEEICPVPLMKRGKQVGEFLTDEHPRADTTIETLSSLKPAFKPDGSVTAGNASGINDGAATVLLASEGCVKNLGLKPMAEIIGWASSGVEPEIMGIGPVSAVQKLCNKTGVAISQVDLFEANEAFASQALAVSRSLELDPLKVNISGGAIALGHPIGASGARVLV